MLYTRKGDSGTTKDFKSGPGVRKSKSSCQTEALGALDELNSFLGFVKVKSDMVSWSAGGRKPAEIVHWLQDCLFTVQAELAGADKHIDESKLQEVERITDAIEAELPPIRTFLISGGSELTALFDISRTLARKAERRVVASNETGEVVVVPMTLAFLNRLSSILYALARLNSHKSGINETPPRYE